jgi:hypothetical protein
MKLRFCWNLLAFTLVVSVCSGAEEAAKTDREAIQQRTTETQSKPEAKQNPVKIDPYAVAVTDGTTETKSTAVVPVAPTEKDAKAKDPAAAAEAAIQAEKTRIAEEASAFAKGEGERYARRQAAYEAARSAARPPVEPAKKSSIAEMQLPDGRYVVLAGGDRKVFASKTEAEPYLAEIRRNEADRPIVLGSGGARK